jgi:transcriptional regulator with XRE-family HTH domain
VLAGIRDIDNRQGLFCDRTSLYMDWSVRRATDSEDFKKLVGERLKALRLESGISQRGLAKRLDISHQQLQKYERGANALPLERVQAIASALGVAPGLLAFPEVDAHSNATAAKRSPDRIELLRLYDRLPDKECRKRALDLLRSVGALVNRQV